MSANVIFRSADTVLRDTKSNSHLWEEEFFDEFPDKGQILERSVAAQ